jgi:hypothetical protein
MKSLNGYGFVDYHSGDRGDGTNTVATAGLAFDDGFGHGGIEDEKKNNANTAPTCKQKSLEQEYFDRVCQTKTDMQSCHKLKYGEVDTARGYDGSDLQEPKEKLEGKNACHWDRNRCKPKWITGKNTYGWCYDKDVGTSLDAYNAC